MAVGLYVTTQDELTTSLQVATRFARAFGNQLIVFVPGRDDALLAKAVRAKIKAFDGDAQTPKMRCQALGDDNVEPELFLAAKRLNKLLIPHTPAQRDQQADLADRMPCTTIRLLTDESPEPWERICVARDGYRHGSARRAARRICESMDECEVVITGGEPAFTSRDLVLIGTPIDREREAEDIEEAERIRSERESPPSVGVVLTGHSAGRRIYAAFENMVQRFVPQMERAARQQLTRDLQVFVTSDEKNGKNGNQSVRNERFDFVAMIGASAALATLGLVQDSAAVIIGAMLVAPLMSPILAASLAIVHSNRVLFRRAWHTIAMGFLFAFGVSFVVGLVYPWVADVSLTREMASRCEPSLMDFLIGIAGGGAAAYARTRNQLSSALAGAAIAAALVPPVAAAGLHLALGLTTGLNAPAGVSPPAHPVLGPLLLFAMNVVSIMLAAGTSLWTAGLRSWDHKAHSRDWQLKIIAVLLALGGTMVAVAYAIDVNEVIP